MVDLYFAKSDSGVDRPEAVSGPEVGSPATVPASSDSPQDQDQAQGKGQGQDKGKGEGESQPAGAGAEARQMLTTLLPWGISFLFHAILVLIAFFAIWIVLNKKQEEKTIVPSVHLSANPGSPMSMEQSEMLKPSSSSRSVSQKPTPSQTNSLTNKVNLKTKLIGVKGSSGGKSSPFGSTIGSGTGFDAKFMGSGGNAHSIVFVVDASGSLLDTFPFVILELKKTIRGLSPKQTFTVVFFQGNNQTVELSAPRMGMKSATQQVKDAATRWLDLDKHHIDPHGRTNPIPAIKKALSYRPELMYLLSDNITGGGTGATQYELEQQRLLAQIKRANRSKTKINTIQFLYKDPLVKAGREPTLELIAEQSGGVYKFVDNEELNIPPTGQL